MPSPCPGMNPYFERADHWLDFHILEVRDRLGRELVTVIELLSPSNKRAVDDREQYLARRRELFRSSTHLVETDLLRGWAPMIPAESRGSQS